jgi:hypothetical protein
VAIRSVTVLGRTLEREVIRKVRQEAYRLFVTGFSFLGLTRMALR